LHGAFFKKDRKKEKPERWRGTFETYKILKFSSSLLGIIIKTDARERRESIDCTALDNLFKKHKRSRLYSVHNAWMNIYFYFF